MYQPLLVPQIEAYKRTNVGTGQGTCPDARTARWANQSKDAGSPSPTIAPDTTNVSALICGTNRNATRFPFGHLGGMAIPRKQGLYKFLFLFAPLVWDERSEHPSPLFLWLSLPEQRMNTPRK